MNENCDNNRNMFLKTKLSILYKIVFFSKNWISEYFLFSLLFISLNFMYVVVLVL